MENEKIWSAASRACERIGGHLLQVNSSYENEFIWTTMESIDAEFVWLGITDQADEGNQIIDLYLNCFGGALLFYQDNASLQSQTLFNIITVM